MDAYDFAIQTADVTYIVDWKTGIQTEASFQRAYDAAFRRAYANAFRKIGVSPPRNVNVPHPGATKSQAPAGD